MNSEPLFPVFGIQRLRMETDGAGVTTLVGLLGCPLRCRYCLNPHAGRPDTPHRNMTAEALIAELAVDDVYFTATGGGVTFGGGEPLLHAGAILEFARKRPPAWRICLETSLHAPSSVLESLLPVVDGFIVDVKDLDPERYARYTGGSIEPMLANLRALAAHADRVRVRVPEIEGYNTAEDCDRTEAALRQMGLRNIERFHYVTDPRRLRR